MGAVPRSLRIAVRDLAPLAAAAFVGGGVCDVLATRMDRAETIRFLAAAVRHGAPAVTMPAFPWGGVLHDTALWTCTVVLWCAVCWCVARARPGRITPLLTAAAAVVVVAVRSVVALLPTDWVSWYGGLWPGPALPYTMPDDGDLVLSWAHPAWGFPVLSAALVVVASLLGGRAARLPDDAASRRVAAPTRAGAATAAVVVGLPTLGAVGAACVGYLAADRRFWVVPADGPRFLVGDLGLPLLVVLAAVALLSGTGQLGVLTIALLGLTVVAGPAQFWLDGGTDAFLGQVAGCAAAVVAVALWRPTAAWGGEILAPLRRAEAPGDEPVGSPTLTED